MVEAFSCFCWRVWYLSSVKGACFSLLVLSMVREKSEFESKSVVEGF
jgi:hypothetical protein